MKTNDWDRVWVADIIWKIKPRSHVPSTLILSRTFCMNTNVNNAPVMKSNFSYCKWVARSTNKTCKLVSSIDGAKFGGYVYNNILLKSMFKISLTIIVQDLVHNKANTWSLKPYKRHEIMRYTTFAWPYYKEHRLLSTKICTFSSPAGCLVGLCLTWIWVSHPLIIGTSCSCEFAKWRRENLTKLWLALRLVYICVGKLIWMIL